MEVALGTGAAGVFSTSQSLWEQLHRVITNSTGWFYHVECVCILHMCVCMLLGRSCDW